MRNVESKLEIMSSVKEIEQAVLRLSAAELRRIPGMVCRRESRLQPYQKDNR
jgi:hypothetical protein